MGLSPTTRVSRKHETIFQPWDGDTEGLPYLGTGVSGAVFAIDEDRVVKIDVGTQRSIDDIESERLAYRSFVVAGGHRNVLRCFELEHEDGIVFQRCQETLRTRIRSKYQCGAPRIRTLKWALQAAKGLAFVHGCGVIQADVGCHNMLFSQRDTLKLADFAGSSVNGSEPTVNYEPRSRLPGRKPSVQTDIFALGCAVYEMTTGRPPYAEKSTMEVQALYKKQQYPELDCLPKLERIIRLCWMQKYGNVLSIVADLKELLAHEKQIASPSSSASDFSSATTCVSTVSNRSKKSTSSPRSIRVSTPIPMSKSGASLHAHFPDDPVITANASTVSKSLRRPHHDRKTSSGSIPQSQVRPHRRRKTSHDGISSTVGYTEKEKERLIGNGIGATTAGNGNGNRVGAGAAGKRNVLVKSGLTKSALVRNNAWVREKEREKDNEAKKSSFVGWFKWPHSKGISTCN